MYQVLVSSFFPSKGLNPTVSASMILISVPADTTPTLNGPGGSTFKP